MARTATNVLLAGSTTTGRVTTWTVPTGKHFVGTAFWADGSLNSSCQLALNGVNFCLFYAPSGGGPGHANPVVFASGDVVTSPSSNITLSGFLYDN